jgi:signal transduction histidine kinase
MVGYNRDQLIKKHLSDLGIDNSQAEVDGQVKDITRTGSLQFETKHRHNNGDFIDVEIRANYSPLYGGSIFSFIRDISHQKRSQDLMSARLRLMEYSLSHSCEDLLRKTLDEAEDLTGSCIGFYHSLEPDQQMHALRAWSTRTTTHFCKAEGSGRHYPVSQAGVWVDCVHERRPVIHNDYASLSHRKGFPEGHAQVERELLIPVIRNDNVVAVMGLGNKPTDYDQRDVKMVSLLADFAFEMAEHKQTEEKLAAAYRIQEEEKTFYHSIIENIESGILITDLNQRIVLANPYSWRFFNKTGEVVVDRYLYDVCPEIYERIVGGIDSDEIPINTSSHEPLVIGFSRFNLKGADRAIIGNIINFKDLTEIIAIRNEMRQKEHLSAMGELVAGVAHEMRNPLFGMTAVGQILEMELQLNPAQKQLMDSFQKEARRLNTLVEDLLECTRELRIRRNEVNLMEVIDASIRVNEIFSREKKIEINTRTPVQDLRIWADADKLEQVLVNLLKNAIDATRPGGVIYLAATSDDRNVHIRVIDEGHGIPEELVDKIFDVFYTTKKNGTGMGLAISMNIVVAHGGSMTVCNNRNGGATFTVTLPLKEKRP